MSNVLITGASRGIGAETARQFARAGWNVAVNYHKSEREAAALVDELTGLGVRAVALQADVADSEQAARLVARAETDLGGLDCLVCNAGIALPQQLVTDTTDEQWGQVFAADVDGVFYTVRAAVPGFVARKAGSIVTISSMWGVTGGSCEVAYSAAKGAVVAMTKALAKELGPSGITVNCVAPGVIATDMNAHLDADSMAALREETPLERIGTAWDVARAVLFLASPEAGFVTGQVLQTNGGLVI